MSPIAQETISATLEAVDQRLLAGVPLRQAVTQLGISTSTYYRWRRRTEAASTRVPARLRVLERENGRLRRVVADQAIAIEALREISRGSY